MAKGIIDDTNLVDIAAAIRNKNGLTKTYKPSEMASAINNIPRGNYDGFRITGGDTLFYSHLIDGAISAFLAVGKEIDISKKYNLTIALNTYLFAVYGSSVPDIAKTTEISFSIEPNSDGYYVANLSSDVIPSSINGYDNVTSGDILFDPTYDYLIISLYLDPAVDLSSSSILCGVWLEEA